MKLLSSLLKKFKASSPTSKSVNSISTTNPNGNPLKSLSNHNEQKDYDARLKMFENHQRKVAEAMEVRKDRRTLRRQNRFLGFQNYLLLLQNQKLASEKQDLGVEQKVLSEKQKELSRSLRKQRRISEYYRRRLAEIQNQEKFIIG